MFSGESIIDPEFLTDMDSDISDVFGENPKDMLNIQKIRDVMKVYKDRTAFAVIGIEHQTDIHYGMPIRSLLYDALVYEIQRQQIAKKHKDTKDLRGAEYISGLSKEDRLYPVFTIVVYLGEEPWDGPRSLHELLDIPEEMEPFEKLLMDYRMNLLCINEIEDLNLFGSDLKVVFGIMKYRKNKDAMNALLTENRDLLQNLDWDAVQAIAVLGKFPEILDYVENEEKGEKDMYHALRELVSDWADERAKEIAEEKAKELAEEKAKVLAEEKLKDLKESRIKELEERMATNQEVGIRIFIASNVEDQVPKEKIIDKLKKWYQISEMDANRYLAQYAE